MLAVLFAVVALFAIQPYANAMSLRFQIGDCSDDVLRVETRLSDLGYLQGVVNGRWEQADADALAALATANGVTIFDAATILFTNDVLPASAQTGTVFATGAQGFLVTYGTMMPWAEVSNKLVVGQFYTVTSCYSGITLRMVCTDIGNHAKMQPELDWDNATLRGFFSAASSSEKQPIVITVDGILLAASIQQAAPNLAGEALPEYSVYFHNSLTSVSEIPDAEHEAIVHIAANQQ